MVIDIWYVSKNPIKSTKFRSTDRIDRVLAAISKCQTIQVDTETTGLFFKTSEILLYQIGCDGVQFVFDNSTFPISILKEILETKHLILHNAKFDLCFLYKYGIVPTKVWDTFLAESVLTTGLITAKRGLADVALKYLNINIDKSIRDNFTKKSIGEDEIEYAGMDVVYLKDIMKLQQEALIIEGTKNTAILENRFVLALAYIEFCGVSFNPDMWKKKCQEDAENLIKIRDRLNTEVKLLNDPEFYFEGLFGGECLVDWASPKQVVKLFNKLGVDTTTVDKKTGISKHSVQTNNIENQKDVHPIIPIYIEYKKAEKLVTSFGEGMFKMYHEDTGRIYTKFRQILDTGRVSCGGKDKDGNDYPNLQQTPSDDRHRMCITVRPGNKLIIADYSSQESRILVDISKESAMTTMYKSGEDDLHSFTAKLVYPNLEKFTLKEIKNNYPEERGLMKTVNFGLSYGGEASTIARNAGIPMEKAREVYEKYFEIFKELKSYFEKAKEFPIRHGYVLVNNISGRKSYIEAFDAFIKMENEINNFKFWSDYRKNKTPDKVERVKQYFRLKGSIERKGLNFVIQGTAADMSKLAAYNMFEYLRNKGLLFTVLMPHMVHDEIHLECPEHMAEELSVVLVNTMESAGAVFCNEIPIKAEVAISDWWSK